MRPTLVALTCAAQFAMASAIACGSSVPSTDAAPVAAESTGQGTIMGEATYRERIALSPDATFEAILQDVSRVDAPGTAIGRQLIENPGQVPISFSISFDSSRIDPRRNYVVRARIRDDGRLTWVSSRPHPVLTQGNETTVSIRLRQVGTSENEVLDELLLAGEMTYLADVARLTECSTRRIFPIASEHDFPDMRQAYRALTRSPGAPLYVTFYGSVLERQRPTGTGQTATVVVTNFIDGWPRQTCASSSSNLPLLDTRWGITRIRGERLTNVTGRAAPYLQLSARGDSLVYSTSVGCNGIGGTATRTGNHIAFGTGIGTMMACGAPLDSLERRLIDALRETTHWRVIGSTLEFEDDDGFSLILFEASKRP